MAASARVIPTQTPVTVSPSEPLAPTEISEVRRFQDTATLAYQYCKPEVTQTDHRKKIGSELNENYRAEAKQSTQTRHQMSNYSRALVSPAQSDGWPLRSGYATRVCLILCPSFVKSGHNSREIPGRTAYGPLGKSVERPCPALAARTRRRNRKEGKQIPPEPARRNRSMRRPAEPIRLLRALMQ